MTAATRLRIALGRPAPNTRRAQLQAAVDAALAAHRDAYLKARLLDKDIRTHGEYLELEKAAAHLYCALMDARIALNKEYPRER